MLKTLGYDVELFGAKKGKIFPFSPDILSGTKEKPFKIGPNASLQLDNVLCEITSPASTTSARFSRMCDKAKSQTEIWLGKRKIEAVFDSHHEFDIGDVMTPWALMNGCEPDFTADMNDPVAKLDMSLFTTLKTASGHIHIGVHEPEDLTIVHIMQYVRGLDFALAAPMLLLHNDPQRRKLYGRAGRFRVKPYGLEYRTLDNYWLGTGDVDLYYCIFNVIENTMSVSPTHNAWGQLNEAHSEMCEAINEGNCDKVSDLMKFNPFYQLDYKNGSMSKQNQPSFLTDTNWLGGFQQTLATSSSLDAAISTLSALDEEETDEN